MFLDSNLCFQSLGFLKGFFYYLNIFYINIRLSESILIPIISNNQNFYFYIGLILIALHKFKKYIFNQYTIFFCFIILCI